MKSISLNASSEEVTRAVAEAAGWQRNQDGQWIRPNDLLGYDELPPYATSLDALVPLLGEWSLGCGSHGVAAWVRESTFARSDIDTVPARALAFAYLRSQGWEVTDG